MASVDLKDKLVTLEELGLVKDYIEDEKLDTDISGLSPLPQAPSGTDIVAIRSGNTTYKAPLSAIAPTPLVTTIPTGQWSGSGSDYYISITASNVNANSILIPSYDHDSELVLSGPVWCVPNNGSFTIHTSSMPNGTVTIMVQFVGTLGEAQYQVLADVYSKSQTDALVQQLAANFMIANVSNINSVTDKTSHTINVPNNSLHFLFIESTSTGLHAYGMVASTAAGALTTQTMQKTNGITLTNSTETITVDLGSASRPLHLVDIRMRGSGFCTLS